MEIVNFTFIHNNDFKAIYKCEHCNSTVKMWGYNSEFFYDTVIPMVCCPNCGLNSYKENEYKCYRNRGINYYLNVDRAFEGEEEND